MMIKNCMFFAFTILLILILTVGCQTIDKKEEEPFIFSYTENSMENENNETLNQWLINARINTESNIHSYDMDNGYHYFYAKGYSDVVVTYEREQKKEKQYSIIKADFKKGKETDEVFIEVKYNPTLCCDGIVVDGTYEGE